jgi:hypothetical protein
MPKTKVKIKLVGQDGNAMLIIGRVRRALVLAGHEDLAKDFVKEAMNGDYGNVLRTCMEYVEVS